MELWEILVPCKFEDTQKPVRTKHHKQWDKVVRKIARGLSLYKPIHGEWVHEGVLYKDRNIPVRIACDEKQMQQIAIFTKQHYRQIAVFYYQISNKVFII